VAEFKPSVETRQRVGELLAREDHRLTPAERRATGSLRRPELLMGLANAHFRQLLAMGAEVSAALQHLAAERACWTSTTPSGWRLGSCWRKSAATRRSRRLPGCGNMMTELLAAAHGRPATHN